MPVEVADANALHLMTPEEAALQAKEIELAKQVAELLDRTYPGHLWAVAAHGGVVNVKNLALEGLWGFILHSHALVNGDMPKAVMRAGGELLERFRISRGRAGVNQAGAFLQERMRQPVLKLPSWAR